MSSPRSVDQDTIRLFSGGCQKAFASIYAVYKDRLYYFFLKFIKDPLEAEELLQSIFVKLWEKRKSIRPNTSFEAFLFTTAKHLALDALKSKTKQQLIALHETYRQPQNTTEDQLFFEEYQSLTEEAIEQLPEKRQIIFRMNHEEGLNVAEIANLLQLSPSTVKTQLSKASQAIRHYVQTHGELIFMFLLTFWSSY